LDLGNVPCSFNFDEVCENWKKDILCDKIYQMSSEWVIDDVVFEKAIESYSISDPNEIPYIDELTSSIDYDSIENPKTSNLLEHNIALSNALPEIVPKLKKKYK